MIIHTGPRACARICFVALIPHGTPHTAQSLKNPLDLDLDLSSMIKLRRPKVHALTPGEALWQWGLKYVWKMRHTLSRKFIMHIIIMNIYKETCFPIIFLYLAHILYMWHIHHMCLCIHTYICLFVDWLLPRTTVKIKWTNICKVFTGPDL